MKDHRHFFTPDNVDEQVEQLAPNPKVTRLPRNEQNQQPVQAEERLVQNLQAYYRPEGQKDAASLVQAWQRVSTRVAGNHELSSPAEKLSLTDHLRSSQERTRTMRKHVLPHPRGGKMLRGLSSVAAVLLVALLVGAMVFALNAAHQQAANHRHNTNVANTGPQKALPPSLLPDTPSSPGLYILATQDFHAETSQVMKVDKDTGAILWHHDIGLSEAMSVIVDDNIVFGTSGDPGAYGGNGGNHSYVYALDAQTGSLRWRTALAARVVNTNLGSSPYNLGVLGQLTFANGVIYVGNAGGQLFALNGADGALLWTYDAHAADLVNGTAYSISRVAVANGVTYGATYNKLYALDTKTGKALWTSAIDPGYTLNSPQIVNGTIYIAAGILSTHTGSTSGKSSVYAFSADHGQQLWRTDGFTWMDFSPLTVANGMVYVADYYYGVYGLDASNGHIQWKHGIGGSSQPVVANNVLYVNGGTYQAPLLSAYNASNGAQLWVKFTPANPVAVSNGKLYATAQPGLLFVFDAASGSQLSRRVYGQVGIDKTGQPNAAPLGIVLVP